MELSWHQGWAMLATTQPPWHVELHKRSCTTPDMLVGDHQRAQTLLLRALFLNASRSAERWVCEMTVSTRAIALRTTLLRTRTHRSVSARAC